jgi:plasmid stability protein
MAQLIVRNIDEQVVKALKQRAAAKGHSAEAEHRDLLEEVLLGPRRSSFKDYLRAMPRVSTRRSRSPVRKVEL